MKIVVIGTGYVGLVTGVCLADLDNQVTCVDIDENKIKKLQSNQVPFFEPGLEEILKRNIESGRLMFSTSLKDFLKDVELVFIAVGTPPKENGEADLSQVMTAAEAIGKNLDHYVVVIDKSTVPVGTAQRVRKEIAKFYTGEFDIVSNPEFLREGSAIEDFRQPDRIVVGCSSKRSEELMNKLYENFNCPKVFTTPASAEMIKYASNAFLATKISFINEIANVCESVGADVEKVAEGMGLDSRIGHKFLQAGIGYGGSCFPKDVRALHQIAGRHGYPFQLLRAVIEVNNNQKWLLFQKIKDQLGDLAGKKIGVWGLAFKPNTDDVRESVALEIIDRAIENEAQVKVYDPEAAVNAQRYLSPKVEVCSDKYAAAADVDCLLIITEWDEFKNPDWQKLKSLIKNPLIIDGRNMFDPAELAKLGFKYLSVGR
ncbi:MAG: UDP-glucose/GDP-mannose dehydrogenase family protein [Patescibacteria group bacterium]